MSTLPLTQTQKLELYYWMRLTRTFDDMMVAYWKQGKGLGGTFSQRGHEATSVGAGYALAPEDIVAPMHRDIGCYMLRGLTPRRIFSNLLGKDTGASRGSDANLHGMGDLSHNIVGYISHLPQSLPVAVGVAMSFTYRNEKRVAMTFVGDGSSNAGVFHESLNLAAIFNAPFVVIIENNQYAYSTPVSEHTKIVDIANKAQNYGIPSQIVDGNDVEAVYTAVKAAVDRARIVNPNPCSRGKAKEREQEKDKERARTTGATNREKEPTESRTWLPPRKKGFPAPTRRRKAAPSPNPPGCPQMTCPPNSARRWTPTTEPSRSSKR